MTSELDLFAVPAAPRRVASSLFQMRPQNDLDFARYTSESDSREVFVHRRVFQQMEVDARRAVPAETIGVLVGRVCHDQNGIYVLVLDVCTALPEEHEGEPGRVRISVAGKAALHRRAEWRWRGLEIVGWWHSHPFGGAIFSSEDRNEQATRDENHVGIVVAVSRSGRAAPSHRARSTGVYLGREADDLTLADAPAIGDLPTDPQRGARSGRRAASLAESGQSVSRAQLGIATAIILAAIGVSAWWTGRHQHADPVRVLDRAGLAESIVRNRIVSVPTQGCASNSTVFMSIAQPSFGSRWLLVSSTDPAVATGQLDTSGSRIKLLCLAPGRASVTVRDRAQSGAGVSVGVTVVPRPSGR